MMHFPVQPLDAIGLSIEGGILGAADTKWIAKRTMLASLLSLGALQFISTHDTTLTEIWVCLKLLNVSALALDLYRFMGPSIFSTTKQN